MYNQWSQGTSFLGRQVMRYRLLILFLGMGLICYGQVQIKQLKMAESRFCQTRTSSMLGKPEVMNGYFRFVAPDSVCWKYDGLDNVKLPKQMLELIRQSVSGDMQSVNEAFKIIWQDDNMVMMPLKNQIKRFFTSIIIMFDKEGVAKKIILLEPNGDTTEIEFLKLKYTAK